MGHKTITEKLDHIEKEDLGIHFDQPMLWNALEAQLDQKKKAGINAKFLIAACITFLILFLPFVLMNDWTLLNDQPMRIERAEKVVPVDTVVIETQFVDPKTESPTNVTAYRQVKPARENLPTPMINEEHELETIAEVKVEETIITEPPVKIIEEKTKRRVFALQDISVIQASLEKPTIERERGMAIKAQLHSGSQTSDLLTNKELKFTLYAKQD